LDNKKDIKINFNSEGKSVTVKAGSNLLQVAQKAKINIANDCGGRGTCGKCKVRILNPRYEINESERYALSEHEISDGIHLACQVTLTEDTDVDILGGDEKYKIRTLVHSVGIHYNIDPQLRKVYLELPKPDIHNQIDDISNFETHLDNNGVKVRIPIGLLQNFSGFLRKNDYKVTFVISHDTLINIESGDTTERKFGLVFDLGTTTIAGSLIDMVNGDELAIVSESNPQRKYGLDVISRINYAKNEPGGLLKLQNAVIETINQMIEALIADAPNDVSFREIYEISIAGNTIMSHILLGIDPQYIGESPYIPSFRKMRNINAEELGLTLLPRAQLVVLPNISGYVGGDITALILAKAMYRDDKISLGIDVGTNGEIVLGSKRGLKCCSAAAGPAFEGGHISCGMRAENGAIDKVVFNAEDIFYDVIDEAEPRGICGTGLLDIVAGMLMNGVIDESGRIRPLGEIENEFYRSRIFENDFGLNFIIVPKERTANNENIYISQRDIREVQLAKAAFQAGINILIKDLGIDPIEIERVYLAGAFGSYLNKFSALTIGLLPAFIDAGKVHFVGNTAIAGARKYLLSKNDRVETDKILELTDYIELSMRPDFQEEFADSIEFKLVERVKNKM